MTGGKDTVELILERTIDAPRQQVWEAVANPATVSRWWCAGDPVEVAFERSVGGRYTERYRGEDTDHYDLAGEVVAFDPERRLAISRETGGRFGPEDRIELTLREDADRTQFRLSHRFPHLHEDRRPEVADYYEQPWSKSIDALAALVTSDG